MYGDFNGNGTVNRMPKAKPETPATGSSLGKSIGGTLVQAAALVVAIKVVDLVIELALARFRKPKQEQARNRREEPVGV